MHRKQGASDRTHHRVGIVKASNPVMSDTVVSYNMFDKRQAERTRRHRGFW